MLLDVFIINSFIGPTTWKSLSIAAALGGCLLVSQDLTNLQP